MLAPRKDGSGVCGFACKFIK